MTTILAVAIGGAVGAVLRHAVSTGVYSWLGSGFPLGTLAVNVLGSVVMGAVIEAGAVAFKLTPELRALIVTGLLGAFTTFSAFALDAATLFDRQAVFSGFLYVVLSVAMCIGGFYVGAGAIRLALS